MEKLKGMNEDKRRWTEDFFGDIRLVKMNVISFIMRLDSKKENEPLKNKKAEILRVVSGGRVSSSWKNYNE